MEQIPQHLRDRLVRAGYHSQEYLPNFPESNDWNQIRIDCGFSHPEIVLIKNKLFPNRQGCFLII